MGRGRAKAKQTKVARELKYHTLDTDLDALQRELGSGDVVDRADGADGADGADDGIPDWDDGDDRWAGYVAEDEDQPARRG